MTVHFVHGLRVDGDLVTGHVRPQGGSRPIVTVRSAGERVIPGRIAGGDVLQAVADDVRGMLSSTVRREDGSTLLRIHRHVDFEMSADLAEVAAWSDPDSSREMTEIFASGSLMASQLMLRGALVLHASAVEVSGQSIAFVGDSGAGKSTMTALACTRGGRIVTDDVLRVDLGGPARCWLGSTENRLRFDLSRSIPADRDRVVGESADGRTVWSPEASDHELSPLVAVVLPRPERDLSEPILEQLGRSEAIVELTRRPRIPGWQDRGGRTSMFTNLATLVAQVPVYWARMPWGPPFSPESIDSLFYQLGLHAPLAARP